MNREAYFADRPYFADLFLNDLTSFDIKKSGEVVSSSCPENSQVQTKNVNIYRTDTHGGTRQKLKKRWKENRWQ